MKVQNKPAHFNCEKGDIAEMVLMPGDPLRAKYIADNFLDDAKLVTDVRNMYGYTGTYKGKRVSIVGSGMGIPSMGIYAYELYKFFDVDTIIRIGSCGNPLDPETKLMDIIIGDSAYSKSNFAKQLYDEDGHYVEDDALTTDKICKTAESLGIKYRKGTIMTTEVFDFYIQDLERELNSIPEDIQNKIVAAEMECYALYHIARLLNKKASCIATVVDSKFSDDFISIEDREKSLNEMITLALESTL